MEYHWNCNSNKMIENVRFGFDGTAPVRLNALLLAVLLLFASTNACPITNWGDGCSFICNCLSGPCDQRTGRCEPEKCVSGWFGKSCNITEACLWNTCQNGGVCFNSYKVKDGYYCSCAYGFTGQNCEQGHKVSIIRNVSDIPARQNNSYNRVTLDDLVPDNHTYLGCFSDPGGKDVLERYLERSDNMTLRSCVLHCSTQVEKLTVVALKKGRECRCSDSYGMQGKSVSNILCNTRCKSDSYCGGDEHNSIYSICPVGYWGALCKSQCHCSGTKPCYFLSGKCMGNSTECKPGWSGTSCNREIQEILITPRLSVTVSMVLVVAYTAISLGVNVYYGSLQLKENLIYSQINDNLREGKYYDNTAGIGKIQRLAAERMEKLNIKRKEKPQQKQTQQQLYQQDQQQ